MEQKNLNLNLLTEGLPLTDVQTLYHEFFYRKDYQWWRDVEPGDIVVDIGACVGFFVCHALDRNAGRIILELGQGRYCSGYHIAGAAFLEPRWRDLQYLPNFCSTHRRADQARLYPHCAQACRP